MYDVYVIKNNDTISDIARKYNTSPSVIYQINGITSDAVLVPGTTIIVPKTSSNYFDYYTVTSGDNLYQIATKSGIDYNLLAQINGIDVNDYIYPNQKIMIPKKGVNFYITKEGDTLEELANKLRTNVNNLLMQNRRIYLLPEQLVVYKN